MKVDQRKIFTFLFFFFCSISIIGLTRTLSNNIIKEYSDLYLKGNFFAILKFLVNFSS